MLQTILIMHEPDKGVDSTDPFSQTKKEVCVFATFMSFSNFFTFFYYFYQDVCNNKQFPILVHVVSYLAVFRKEMFRDIPLMCQNLGM